MMRTADGHSCAPTLVAPERTAARSAAVRVLVVHRDASFRRLVSALLEQSGIGVVACVPDGEAAVRAAQRSAPALVLVGADIDGPSVSRTTRRLARAAPASRVLVFGTAGSEDELGDTLAAGAAGYVRIDARAERLDVTVRIAIALLTCRSRAG